MPGFNRNRFHFVNFRAIDYIVAASAY